jgi:hypothetical protein
MQENQLIAAQGELGICLAVFVAEFDFINIGREALNDSANFATMKLA